LVTNVELLRDPSERAKTTEVHSRRLRVDTHAKDGILNTLTSMQTLLKRKRAKVLKTTTSAETQVTTVQPGVTPLIRRRDGIIVLQENLVQEF
jgi:hypothetical protein